MGRRDRDCMVVGYTYALKLWVRIPIRQGVLDTTLWDKFVSDLRQVGGFLRVLRFAPPITLTATI
jgi:hypothetical protein